MRRGDADAPRISFPCDYPVKVVGEAHDTFEETVVAIAARHDPTITPARVSSRASRSGNYLSVTVTLTAASEEQIRALFTELQQLESVRLVL